MHACVCACVRACVCAFVHAKGMGVHISCVYVLCGHMLVCKHVGVVCLCYVSMFCV